MAEGSHIDASDHLDAASDPEILVDQAFDGLPHLHKSPEQNAPEILSPRGRRVSKMTQQEAQGSDSNDRPPQGLKAPKKDNDNLSAGIDGDSEAKPPASPGEEVRKRAKGKEPVRQYNRTAISPRSLEQRKVKRRDYALRKNQRDLQLVDQGPAESGEIGTGQEQAKEDEKEAGNNGVETKPEQEWVKGDHEATEDNEEQAKEGGETAEDNTAATKTQLKQPVEDSEAAEETVSGSGPEAGVGVENKGGDHFEDVGQHHILSDTMGGVAFH
jgi:hypothetical protein